MCKAFLLFGSLVLAASVAGGCNNTNWSHSRDEIVLSAGSALPAREAPPVQLVKVNPDGLAVFKTPAGERVARPGEQIVVQDDQNAKCSITVETTDAATQQVKVLAVREQLVRPAGW